MQLEGINAQGLIGKPESNPRRLTAEELSEGMYVMGKIHGVPFDVGRIHLDSFKTRSEIKFCICQNIREGQDEGEMYGFQHSWTTDEKFIGNEIELYRIPAPEPVKPEPPAFKVGDRVEIVGRAYGGCMHRLGDSGAIVSIDKTAYPYEVKFLLSTCFFYPTSLKLLQPEPCIPVEAKYEYTVDPTMTNVVKGLLKTKPITPEATVKLRTATHGPASRTTLEVDKSIFPLSDIAGINAALKPYGLHMQKTGKKK